MSDPEEYDLVILGSGEPGKYLAWTLAAQGWRVAVVERRYVGGSCPNIACLPSKNVIHSAKVVSYFRRAKEFGIATADWSIDMAAVGERKRSMVDGLVEMHLAKFRASGAELVFGDGRFTGRRTVQVALRDGGTRVLRGKNVVINTGTRATVEATPGLRDAKPLTHIEALELDRVPDHLIVLGGGYVGLELAQAFRRLGAEVTVVERNPALVHREDEDVSAAMGQLFEDEGIALSTDTIVERVAGTSGEAVQLHVTRGGTTVEIEGTHLLVAAGRTPNTGGIGRRPRATGPGPLPDGRRRSAVGERAVRVGSRRPIRLRGRRVRPQPRVGDRPGAELLDLPRRQRSVRGNGHRRGRQRECLHRWQCRRWLPGDRRCFPDHRPGRRRCLCGQVERHRHRPGLRHLPRQ